MDDQSKIDLSYLESLPYELFLSTILDNDFSAKELEALCSSNSGIRAKCHHNNQELYQALIKRDYGVSYQDLMSKRTPKEFYHLANRHSKSLDYLQEYYPTRYDQLLRYWIKNLEEIIDIVHDHFPEDSRPRWIIYNFFEQDQVSTMSEKLFDDLSKYSKSEDLEYLLRSKEEFLAKGYTEEKYKNELSNASKLNVDFSFQMFPYIDSDIDLGASRMWNAIYESGPSLEVTLDY